MITSKLTAKAQTTVPQAVRRALQLHPGDELAYRVQGDQVILTRAVPPAEGDPFAAFDEWASPEDEAAYAEL